MLIYFAVQHRRQARAVHMPRRLGDQRLQHGRVWVNGRGQRREPTAHMGNTGIPDHQQSVQLERLRLDKVQLGGQARNLDPFAPAAARENRLSAT